MKTPLSAVLLVLLLGIAPATAAPDGPVFADAGTIDSERLEATRPVLDGTFSAVSSTVPSDGGVPAGFALTAERIHLRVDRADLAVAAANYARAPYTRESDHRNVTVGGLENRPAGQLFVLPLPDHEPPRLDVDARCLDLRAANPRDVARWEPRLNNSHGPYEADLENDLRVFLCSEYADVLVTGSFLVGLWDWDVRLQDDQGTHRLPTGYHDNADGVTQNVAEAFLTVHDATLRVPVNYDSLRLHVDHTIVESDLVRFFGASGRYETDARVDADGEDLTFRGGVRVAVRVAEGRVVSELLAPDEATTGSTPLTALATPLPSAPWLLPVAALVLLAVGAFWLHRRRAPQRALDLLWTGHELDLSLAPRTRRERRALGMQLLGARLSMDGDVERGQRLQERAADLYGCPVEALLGLGETLLALGAYEHALDALFLAQECVDATATQRVRAQLGAAAAHLRRNAPADQHVCVEYLRDADAHDPSTVRRLLDRAGDLGAELARVLPRARPSPGSAMFG